MVTQINTVNIMRNHHVNAEKSKVVSISLISHGTKQKLRAVYLALLLPLLALHHCCIRDGKIACFCLFVLGLFFSFNANLKSSRDFVFVVI